MPENTPKKSAENAEKITEKFFSETAKRGGNSVLPLSVVDILVSVWAGKSKPLTVSDIQKILAARGAAFDTKGIRRAMNNIHRYCPNIELISIRVKAGYQNRCRAWAFSIRFKTETT